MYGENVNGFGGKECDADKCKEVNTGVYMSGSSFMLSCMSSLDVSGSEYWCVHVRVPLHAFLHRPHLVPQEVNTGVFMSGSPCMLSCIILT